MLVDLTVNEEVVNRFKEVCKEHNFTEKILCSHPDNHIETGVYRCGCDFNFGFEEFFETENLSYEDQYQAMVMAWTESTSEDFPSIPIVMENQYGVSDNIEQIKEHYKMWLDDPKSKWVITVTPVFQDKSNCGKGGGWRWHKWGEYIGTLNPKHEYLDDEDFGEGFQGYVICYHIYPVKD